MNVIIESIADHYTCKRERGVSNDLRVTHSNLVICVGQMENWQTAQVTNSYVNRITRPKERHVTEDVSHAFIT